MTLRISLPNIRLVGKCVASCLALIVNSAIYGGSPFSPIAVARFAFLQEEEPI